MYNNIFKYIKNAKYYVQNNKIYTKSFKSIEIYFIVIY